MPKLLIIDDEVDILEVTKRYFTRRGVETFATGDGHEALSIIQKENPDLILLDYNLPGLSGIEILKKIREEFKLNTKVIMITGYESDAVLNETKDLGVLDCVHKPLDLGKLEKIVLAELRRENSKNGPGHLGGQVNGETNGR